MCSECGNEYSIKEYEELQAENEKLKKFVSKLQGKSNQARTMDGEG